MLALLIFLPLSRVPFFLCSAYPNHTHSSLQALSRPPSLGSCSLAPKVKKLSSSSLDPYSFITTNHLERLTFSLKFWSKYHVWFPKGEKGKNETREKEKGTRALNLSGTRFSQRRRGLQQWGEMGHLRLFVCTPERKQQSGSLVFPCKGSL